MQSIFIQDMAIKRPLQDQAVAHFVQHPVSQSNWADCFWEAYNLGHCYTTLDVVYSCHRHTYLYRPLSNLQLNPFKLVFISDLSGRELYKSVTFVHGSTVLCFACLESTTKSFHWVTMGSFLC